MFFEPEDLFMGLAVLFAGSILVFEGMLAYNDRPKRATGSVAFVLVLGIGLLLLVYGFAVLFDLYQPIGDDSNFGKIFSVLLFVSLLLLGAAAISEIIVSRRFNKILA